MWLKTHDLSSKMQSERLFWSEPAWEAYCSRMPLLPVLGSVAILENRCLRRLCFLWSEEWLSFRAPASFQELPARGNFDFSAWTLQMSVGWTMAAAVVFQVKAWFCFDLQKSGLLCSWRLQVGGEGKASWWGWSPGLPPCLLLMVSVWPRGQQFNDGVALERSLRNELTAKKSVPTAQGCSLA